MIVLYLLFHQGLAAERAREGVVEIPAGTFTQGSGRGPDDPQRAVEIAAFGIDRTEVSVAAFEAFAATAWQKVALWSAEGWSWAQANPGGAGAAMRAAGRPGDHPVVAVTWFEAEAYCRAAGGGLPSESQWERAACGDGGRRFPWGDDERDAAWYAEGKLGHLKGVATRAVDDQDPSLASPFGLVHAAGNVWEWTADGYRRDSAAPAEGSWKTMRGGSYGNLPSYCGCTHREPALPKRVSFSAGFRCAYPPP